MLVLGELNRDVLFLLCELDSLESRVKAADLRSLPIEEELNVLDLFRGELRLEKFVNLAVEFLRNQFNEIRVFETCFGTHEHKRESHVAILDKPVVLSEKNVGGRYTALG